MIGAGCKVSPDRVEYASSYSSSLPGPTLLYTCLVRAGSTVMWQHRRVQCDPRKGTKLNRPLPNPGTISEYPITLSLDDIGPESRLRVTNTGVAYIIYGTFLGNVMVCIRPMIVCHIVSSMTDPRPPLVLTLYTDVGSCITLCYTTTWPSDDQGLLLRATERSEGVSFLISTKGVFPQGTCVL